MGQKCNTILKGWFDMRRGEMHFKNSPLGIFINMTVLLILINGSVFNVIQKKSQRFFHYDFRPPKGQEERIASVLLQGLISNICFCRWILLVEFLLGFHNSISIVSKQNFCTTEQYPSQHKLLQLSDVTVWAHWRVLIIKITAPYKLNSYVRILQACFYILDIFYSVRTWNWALLVQRLSDWYLSRVCWRQQSFTWTERIYFYLRRNSK